MALPFPDAPPNFLSTFIQARRAGQEDRLATERQNALSMIGTNPQKARSALMGVGDFQAVGAIDRDQDRATQRRVLSQYGKDPGAARTAAFEAGDPELISAISQLDKSKLAEANERAQRLAGVGYALKQRPYAERRAALQQIAPALQQVYGFTPEQLAAFDPSDETLDALISSTMSVKEQIELKLKTEDDALDDEYRRAQIEATRALVGQRGASADAARARAAKTRSGGGGSSSSGLPAGFVLE
jgi:hypothetical protein